MGSMIGNQTMLPDSKVLPMPSDFAPDMDFQIGEGGKRVVVCDARYRVPEGDEVGINANIGLGFVVLDDWEKNGKLMRELWQAVWQALEFARLGRHDELKTVLRIT